MKFFGLEMTPSPPFWTFFPKFTTKIYRFGTQKIWTFFKKTSIFGETVVPKLCKLTCDARVEDDFLFLGARLTLTLTLIKNCEKCHIPENQENKS